MQEKSGLEEILKELGEIFTKLNRNYFTATYDSKMKEHVNIEQKVERFFDGSQYPVSLVKGKMQDWRVNYSQDYENCYGTLCIPGLFELYIRHELILWDPLNGKTDFESFKFHEILSDYLDGDQPTLLINVVTKYVFPKLSSLVKYYNFFQKHQTIHLFAVFNQLQDYVDVSEDAFKVFIIF